MLKSLRVPERLFQLATWVVSLLFAGFLTGLGGKIVGDLPGVDRRMSIEQFMDSAQVVRHRVVSDSLHRVEMERDDARDRARLRLNAAANGYRASRASFDNWVATRAVTTDPRQDPEVLRRTRELDALKTAERAAQTEVDALDAKILEATQAQERERRAYDALTDVAQRQFDRAWRRQELRVFGIRLALTLPLLLVAAWLVLRHRRHQYWPLARGFVLFALYAFFFELVPYLPSYGGYVRYGVGVLGTGIAGVYVIRAMQRYVARRAAVERQTEAERRRALGYEEAIRRVSTGVCPGCERAIASTGGGAPANYCVHCGMTLFDECGACHTRKNAFFQYCPACGVDTGVRSAREAAAG